MLVFKAVDDATQPPVPAHVAAMDNIIHDIPLAPPAAVPVPIVAASGPSHTPPEAPDTAAATSEGANIETPVLAVSLTSDAAHSAPPLSAGGNEAGLLRPPVLPPKQS